MAVHEIQAFTNYESKDTSINSRRSNLRERWQLAELGEANVRGVLPEALTAHVEPVLPDQTSLVRAHPALTGSLSVVLRVGVPNSVVTHLDCLISILPQGSLDSTTVCMPGRERVRGGESRQGRNKEADAAKAKEAPRPADGRTHPGRTNRAFAQYKHLNPPQYSKRSNTERASKAVPRTRRSERL